MLADLFIPLLTLNDHLKLDIRFPNDVNINQIFFAISIISVVEIEGVRGK